MGEADRIDTQHTILRGLQGGGERYRIGPVGTVLQHNRRRKRRGVEGGNVQRRWCGDAFFYGFRGVCSAVWRWREERMLMSTAVLREIERERGVCLCGGCRCVFVCGVWSIGAR